MFFQHIKIFNPKYYPIDEVHISMSEPLLERLVMKVGLTTFKSNACRAKLHEFVETLWHECENKSLYEACQSCGGINKCNTNWPHLMKL